MLAYYTQERVEQHTQWFATGHPITMIAARLAKSPPHSCSECKPPAEADINSLIADE